MKGKALFSLYDIGNTKNSFCAIRPPGHHAGVYGQTLYFSF